ncbi:membrane protein insertion efficiency factor YidD [uncultured Campylobacter sp.]|uniref:membrane protein insertion efficiency factor YidD n=1 Tax=uncultured Campylobacter sp. TaxID=218934 RepID=UPI0026306052|nr:membrane protein insertion efficiency factor YidD [uncultured Campylobacter sp.]
MRAFLLCLIKFYQNYISKLLPNSCRYYPSCSEYAIWSFSHQGILRAFYSTLFRILRCNQLFKGGIDYPKVKFISKKKSPFFYLQEPKFWLIPTDKNGCYYVIKAIYKGQ